MVAVAALSANVAVLGDALGEALGPALGEALGSADGPALGAAVDYDNDSNGSALWRTQVVGKLTLHQS
jgi:hypothetical protein